MSLTPAVRYASCGAARTTLLLRKGSAVLRHNCRSATHRRASPTYPAAAARTPVDAGERGRIEISHLVLLDEHTRPLVDLAGRSFRCSNHDAWLCLFRRLRRLSQHRFSGQLFHSGPGGSPQKSGKALILLYHSTGHLPD